MVDTKKVKALTSLLEERSGLDIREAVARNINYLDGYESYPLLYLYYIRNRRKS